MGDETPPRSDQTSDQAGSESSRGGTTDLAGELREMGQQLEAAFRAALESERTKQLQRDMASGMREVSHQIQSALKSLQTNPRVQQAEERGRQAMAQARESKVVQDIQETLVSGLAQLNDQLRKVVERIQTEVNAPSSGASAQNVPVDDQSAATGETTHLKDD